MKTNKIYTNLNSYWVTGFSDGESSFSVAISHSSLYKTGYKFTPSFAIELKDKDLSLLYKIKKFFNDVGRIYLIKDKGHAVYVVTKIEDLENIIIPHFIQYPLLTIKRITFLLFKEIVHSMYIKNHLTANGVKIILAIKPFMNNRILEKKSFLSYLPIILPNISPLSVNDISIDWFVGFTDAEGCFFLNIRPNRNKTNSWVSPVFSLVQHSRDTLLFYLLKEFLGGGYIVEEKNRNVIRYRTENLSFITNIIIPLFNNNSLQSKKIKDYLDFCLACQLINNKAHLTEEGLMKLKGIKDNMNTKRK